MKKDRILTIAINDTYEVPISCDEETLKLIEGYPKTRQQMPIDVLKRIEEAGEYGECVDTFWEVVEVEDIDLWRDSK